MSERRDDAEITRLERRLHDAQDELEEVRRGSAHRAPLLRELRKHLQENQFAERLVAGLEETKRRHA